MNQIILIGRLVKDAESKTTNTGKKIANFTLAVSKGKDTAQFFNCIAWEKTADIIVQYTNKGSQISVIGELQNRSWDKPDGTKGYATDIVVREVELLGKAKESQPTNNEIDLDDVKIEMPF